MREDHAATDGGDDFEGRQTTMTLNDKHDKDDWEMLGHDPVRGYKTAFYIAVLVSVIYLAAAFLSGGGGVAH